MVFHFKSVFSLVTLAEQALILNTITFFADFELPGMLCLNRAFLLYVLNE